MYLRGRNLTVTVTFSLDRSASTCKFSEQKYCGLVRADEDAGELWPSIDVSRKCLDDEVVEDEGEFTAFELLEPNFFDFDPLLEDIFTSPKNTRFYTQEKKNQ